MIRFLSATDITSLVPPAAAASAIEAALRAGTDPAAAIARTSVRLDRGELLLMPASSPTHAGVKLATIAAANPALGLPRVNALYVLFDGATLMPTAVLDGAALTALRTPAVSASVVRSLDRRPRRLVVFGAGPQGIGHIRALSALCDLSSVDLVVRRPDRVDRATLPAGPIRLLPAGSDDVATALRHADIVVCATTARQPLFDSSRLAEHAVVIAVGSHEPDAREVDSAFCARSAVVVEDVATALRECGDVILAIDEGSLTADRLVGMRELVRAATTVAAGPVLFKGSGMAWQDLVIAEEVLARAAG